MKTLKHLTLSMFAGLAFVACETFDTDLDVPNVDAPSEDILLNDVSALEASASGIINTWFVSTQSYNGPGSALMVMSDAFSCSWGNAAMRDTSWEPRQVWNNTTGYGNAFVTETYFNSLASLAADSNNLIRAVEAGQDFENPKMIEAIGRLGQALATGYYALVFDQAYVSDENGMLNEGEPMKYDAAMAAAMEFLDKGIAAANSGSFTLPTSYVPGMSVDNVYLSQFMNTMAARFMTMNSRNASERDATDWNKVLAYANAGITAPFSPVMDDATWLSDIKWTVAYAGWGRVDMRTINLMDPSTPAEWPAGEISLPESSSDDLRLASDFTYLTSQNFRPDRGTYHYSTYRYSRYDTYLAQWVTPVTEMHVAENDMYKVEANLRLGNVSAAASILNAGTRSTRGGLSDVAATADAVEDALHYERIIEIMNSSMGFTFFEMRKNDLLQKDTPLHFPMPGKALETAGIDNYTFGPGSGVPGQDISNGGWK